MILLNMWVVTIKGYYFKAANPIVIHEPLAVQPGIGFHIKNCYHGIPRGILWLIKLVTLMHNAYIFYQFENLQVFH